MKGFDIDKLIIVSLGGKTGRFNYFLSLLIIVVGFYYFFEHYDPNTCHVCFPIMRFPWGELVGLLFILALGGFYSCFFCLHPYSLFFRHTFLFSFIDHSIRANHSSDRVLFCTRIISSYQRLFAAILSVVNDICIHSVHFIRSVRPVIPPYSVKRSFHFIPRTIEYAQQKKSCLFVSRLRHDPFLP